MQKVHEFLETKTYAVIFRLDWNRNPRFCGSLNHIFHTLISIEFHHRETRSKEWRTILLHWKMNRWNDHYVTWNKSNKNVSNTFFL